MSFVPNDLNRFDNQSSVANGRSDDRRGFSSHNNYGSGSHSNGDSRDGAPRQRYIPPHMRNKAAQQAAAPDQPPSADNHADFPPPSQAAGSSGPAPSNSRFDSRNDVRNDSRGDYHRSHDGRGEGRSDGVISIQPSDRRWNEEPREPRSHGDRFGARDVRGGNFGSHSSQSSHDVRFSSLRSGGSSRSAPNIAARDAREELELFGPAAEKKTGIEFKNYEDIPVETSGLDVPNPIDNFTGLDCHEVLLSNIELAGYERPTPVQRYSTPISLAGRDLMACAQTGSGKTAAFLLPLIATILKHELHMRPQPSGGAFRSRQAYPSALVLAPTRELATQIHNEARKFVYRTGLKPVVVYGGQDVKTQLRDIERGCDILVATPGRLVDFLERGRISLSRIEFLVFDEADRMLDMGFEPQIREIVGNSDMPYENRQTLMFSATFPKEIQRLAQDFLKNYVFLAVGRVGSTTDFITQKVEYAGNHDSEKIERLMQILSTCEGLTLIFVETKRGADSLEYALQSEGIEATSIHGDRTQQEREHALQMFRCGRCPVLVATDVASRGLDIPDVRCVVNYDLPSNIDDYVHRIGRTGRAGNKGTAVAFISEKNKAILKDIYDLLKENNQEIPNWFENMALSGGSSFGSSSYGRSRGGGGGRGGRGGGRPMTRDHRSDFGNPVPSSRPAATPRQAEPSPSSSSPGGRSGFGGGGFGGFGAGRNRGGSYGKDAW